MEDGTREAKKMTREEICDQVMAFIAKTIDEYINDDTTDAEIALYQIATMMEVRGMHHFEHMPRETQT